MIPWRGCGISYPADDLVATPTLADEISGAVPGLAVVATAILHIEPISGPGTVSKRLISVDGGIFIDTVQSRGKEDSAVLDQRIVDVEAGSGEGVEGI